MRPKLRVARATNRLDEIAEMYRSGLELDVVASFRDHAGFDGVVLGSKSADYQLEFTREAGGEAPRSASAEQLIVFYVPDEREWHRLTFQMQRAGFVPVPSHNPYWDAHGITFEDPEGYRVVLSGEPWV